MMIIGPDEIAKLQFLKMYAESNRLTDEQLELVRSGKATPIGERVEYRRVLPGGYTIVFTINEAPGEGSGWFRHLSISWLVPFGAPPEAAQIQRIMNFLGFADKLGDQKYVKLDQFKVIPGFPVPLGSINIQELIK